MAKRVVDKRGDGKWVLRIVADNAKIIATGRPKVTRTSKMLDL